MEIINLDRVFTKAKEEDDEGEDDDITARDTSSSYHQLINNPTLTNNSIDQYDEVDLLYQLKKSKSTYIRKASLMTVCPVNQTALDISIQSNQLTAEARRQRHAELNALKFNPNDVKYTR